MGRRWHIYAHGTLPDSSTALIVTISRGYRSKHNFAAVLICRPEGLARIWRNGREKLLSAGFVWPQEKRWHDREFSIRDHVPSCWRSQSGSGCVVKEIPDRLLRSGTDNLARLLLAWWVSKESQFSLENRSLWGKSNTVLPVSKPWHPAVITVIPNTDLVIHALNSGTLLEHLKRGLERIYLSERVLICAPIHRPALIALATRFPERIVIVRTSGFPTAKCLGITRPYAQEYCDVGSDLSGQYKHDYGYDKWDNPSVMDPFFLIRVGLVPRGIQLMPLHEKPVTFKRWASFRYDDIAEMEQETEAARKAQEARAIEVLSQAFAQPEAENGN